MVIGILTGLDRLQVDLERLFDIVVYTPCIHGETILASQEARQVDMDTCCVGFTQR
jgi:hypothetical protein